MKIKNRQGERKDMIFNIKIYDYISIDDIAAIHYVTVYLASEDFFISF